MTSPQALPRTAKQPLDEDLPGMGQYYCETVEDCLLALRCRAGVETGRWFINKQALDQHKKSRFYKMRVKELKGAKPHCQRDAEAAVGLGVDNGPKLGRAPATQPQNMALEQ